MKSFKRKKGGVNEWASKRKDWVERLKGPQTRQLTKKIKAASLLSNAAKRMIETKKSEREAQYESEVASLKQRMKTIKDKQTKRALKTLKEEKQKEFSNERKILEKNINYLSVIQENNDKVLEEIEKNLALTKDISTLMKYTEVADKIKSLYETKNKDDEKKAAKLQREDDYIDGIKLLNTVKEKISEKKITSERKKEFQEIKKAIEDKESQIKKANEKESKEQEKVAKPTTWTKNESILRKLTPELFIRRLTDCIRITGRDSLMTQIRADALNITFERENYKTRTKIYSGSEDEYLVFTLNNPEIFGIEAPAGSGLYVDAHLTVNKIDGPGAKRSHLTIKFWREPPEEQQGKTPVNEWHRYIGNRQPTTQNLLTLTNKPASMTDNDFNVLAYGFMRAFTICLRDNESDRNDTFKKGGKTKKKKYLKKKYLKTKKR